MSYTLHRDPHGGKSQRCHIEVNCTFRRAIRSSHGKSGDNSIVLLPGEGYQRYSLWELLAEFNVVGGKRKTALSSSRCLGLGCGSKKHV